MTHTSSACWKRFAKSIRRAQSCTCIQPTDQCQRFHAAMQLSLILQTHYTFLGNCPPTPPLSQHVALSETYVLMLALGRGRWAVSQKRIMILMGSITLTYPESDMTVVRVLRRELELVYSRGSHKRNNNICM